MINILLTIILSVIIIVIIHYLFNLIKDTYSKKRTRDLVGSQTQKYKIIIDELLQTKTKECNTLSEEDKQILDDDLTSFMNNELSKNHM